MRLLVVGDESRQVERWPGWSASLPASILEKVEDIVEDGHETGGGGPKCVDVGPLAVAKPRSTDLVLACWP